MNFQIEIFQVPVYSEQRPITNRMLNTAEPTMVPVPTSPLAMNTPRMAVNSSGADDPAAINVAPATSCDKFSR